MTTVSSLHDLVADAVEALTGDRWAIADAAYLVPSRPGLYAIYGDEQAWCELQLEPLRSSRFTSVRPKGALSLAT